MRKTSNYELALYDPTDKMSITAEEDSLNANMVIIDNILKTTVKSINNISPDSNGNIDITTIPENNYTNVLPTALDATGNAVYNDIGYKADTRWSGSSGAEATQAGIYLTGYIPVSNGNIIRLKNIKMPNEEGNSCVVWCYSDFNVVNYDLRNTSLADRNAVWDNDNYLTQFTLNVDCKYIRLQGSYMGSDSIVTVNEEIVDGIDATIQEINDDISLLDSRVDNLEALNDAIPYYWQTALDEGVEAINIALTAAGYNKSAFLFYSDAHYNYGSRVSPKLLKYLYKHTGMNKTNFGGDIVNNEADDYDTMKYLWEWRAALKDLPNHHSVVGNHDDGNTTNNLFTEQYVYGYLLGAEETPDIVRGEDGIYYYIDNPSEKTRYLYLDTAYQAMTANQQTFLKEALLTTPDNWHIVAIAHIWYNPDYDQYNIKPIPIKGLNTNAQIATNMFDAYNSRTGDFADCKGWVEFCIGGHAHIDYDGTTATGIPILLVETDSQHIRSTYTYTTGTDTEASINGIVADYDNKKIYVIRIGRGESREVPITTHPVNYTNMISTALDVDGTIYNGVGYKKNTRFSGSSGTFKDNTGSDCTGYIALPESERCTVYLKNLTAKSNDNYGFAVYLLDDLGVPITASFDYSTLSDADPVTYDENGNVTSFTIKNQHKYMVISCANIDASSIITINELIE